jgi:hypothetical protein
MTGVNDALTGVCGGDVATRCWLGCRPLGRKWYKSLRAGDCVVAFSRADIHTLKREIERNTRHRCCVVYGNLPPQTRVEQANTHPSPHSFLRCRC